MTLFNLYRDYQPLKFFSVITLALIIISLGLFLPIGIGFIETGLVPKIPSLIVSATIMMIAFLSFVCGLILDTNAKNSRKNFEVQLNTIKILLNMKINN